MTVPIRRAGENDLAAAADTLAAAFADYAWTRWSVPADDHAARLRELQALYLRHALAHGVVLVSDDVRAVAALLPAGAPAPGSAVQERVAALHGDRLPALLAAELPPRPAGAWDLATLGVHPDARGRGLGSTVVATALGHVAADDPAAVVALETSDERNVRLYERHGFATTARTQVPDGPLVVSMVRAAPVPASQPS
ncbi:GNAT family N-acetyltransferase [Pimelobacter simplex]|uniref:GNAT family N-acetyltransferase n=1 Tax=Nocardioides simplex TaxID=2045 RepID=A0A7J5E073_NOCSI|nr:GNAT family N-acetyltransferase [Pimelobacter simplex]KAB2811577.1 GNAT family N-acetyltransferase [Pimelobacter simplex]